MAVQSSSGREPDIEEGKAGAKAEEAGTSGEGVAAQVSFLTAALMGVALCFHSILEVSISFIHPCSKRCVSGVLLESAWHLSALACGVCAHIWIIFVISGSRRKQAHA